MLAHIAQYCAGRQLSRQERGRRIRNQNLPTVRYRHDALDLCEREIALIVALAIYGGTAVKTHANSQGEGCRMPDESALCIERRCQRIGDGRKRDAKCVAHNLKDETAVRLGGGTEEGMVRQPRGFPFSRVLLGKHGTAFDISKQKGYGASRRVSHSVTLEHNSIRCATCWQRLYFQAGRRATTL